LLYSFTKIFVRNLEKKKIRDNEGEK